MSMKISNHFQLEKTTVTMFELGESSLTSIPGNHFIDPDFAKTVNVSCKLQALLQSTFKWHLAEVQFWRSQNMGSKGATIEGERRVLTKYSDCFPRFPASVVQVRPRDQP